MDPIPIGSSAPSPKIDLSVCSLQVQTLYPLMSEYREQVHKLWTATADNPGPRLLRKREFAYLVSLHYQMPKRADIAGKPMSPEFKELIFFCRHVGPRPTTKHSLHRMDNEIGYSVGNVEWADKRKQAEVRRTTQQHLYLGLHLSDRQLSERLATMGHKITPDAIKKQRQRLRRDGVPRADITGTIFKKIGLPYASSTDPVEAWDFPAALHEKLSRLYPNFRGKNESRIEYTLRWLRQQIHELEETAGNHLTTPQQQAKLGALIQTYKSEQQRVLVRLTDLHQKKTDILIVEAGAPFSVHQQVPPYQVCPLSAIAPIAKSADALITPGDLDALHKRELEQQQRRENVAYLAQIISEHGVTRHLPSPPEFEDIPDGLLQIYANYAYFAVMGRGNAYIRNFLLEYRKRGIPTPGADLPEGLDLA